MFFRPETPEIMVVTGIYIPMSSCSILEEINWTEHKYMDICPSPGMPA